jgi:lia operon protein LiaG
MKKILIIFLILIGLYIVFINVMKFDWMPFGTQETQATVSDKINMIEINVASGNAAIIPEKRQNVKAVLTGKGTVSVAKSQDKITVTIKRKWFEWFSFSTKDDLKIYVPEDYHKNLAIDMGSGNLAFSGPAKSQPFKLEKLTLDVSSGNMNLKNLDVNEFDHDGSSGNVEVDYLTTKTGTFDISSGSIDIKHYQGAIKADLSSGKLNLQMDKLVDSIDIDISSGKVDIDLPDDADFTLRGDTSSGNISCDFPLTTTGANSKSIKGTHGSGKHPINLDVSSGNISIY